MAIIPFFVAVPVVVRAVVDVLAVVVVVAIVRLQHDDLQTLTEHIFYRHQDTLCDYYRFRLGKNRQK